MKQIHFIFIGKPKDSAFADLETAYLKKISHSIECTITHIKDSRESTIDVRKKEESKSVLEKIKKSDVVIVCDEHGQVRTSIQFSQNLKSWMEQGQRVVFIIGGPFGMTDELIKSARFVLRLSDFVLPHELARVVLLEQVYRAFTILSGQKYHH